MSKKTPPTEGRDQFVDAIMETAKDAAKAAAEKIVQPDPKVQDVLRRIYENAFADGVLYVLKNELDQRIADSMALMSRRERRAAERKQKHGKR
jgi:hypothetical protein